LFLRKKNQEIRNLRRLNGGEGRFWEPFPNRIVPSNSSLNPNHQESAVGKIHQKREGRIGRGGGGGASPYNHTLSELTDYYKKKKGMVAQERGKNKGYSQKYHNSVTHVMFFPHGTRLRLI
jgi:hypothetical protein